MRFVLALLVPLAAALLQGSVVPLVTIADARPNLPVLVAASWSVAVGAREAVWWAFLGGIAADLLSGGPLGALALAALPAVAAVGIGDRSVRSVALLPAVALVALAAIASAGAYVAILALSGQALPPVARLLADGVGGALYTAALALVIYPVARLLRDLTEPRGGAA